MSLEEVAHPAIATVADRTLRTRRFVMDTPKFAIARQQHTFARAAVRSKEIRILRWTNS